MTAAKNRTEPAQPLRNIARNDRLKHLEVLLSKQFSGKQIVGIIAEKYEISERQAYLDLAEVYARIQDEAKTDSTIRIGRARRTWARRMRRNERHADKSIAAGNLGAAASFESAANYAADRLMKVDGLYAPKKIEHSGGVHISVGIQLNAIVGILDPQGLAALNVVMQQVEEAKAKGLLKDAEPKEKHVDPIDVAIAAAKAEPAVAPKASKARGKVKS